MPVTPLPPSSSSAAAPVIDAAVALAVAFAALSDLFPTTVCRTAASVRSRPAAFVVAVAAAAAIAAVVIAVSAAAAVVVLRACRKRSELNRLPTASL